MQQPEEGGGREASSGTPSNPRRKMRLKSKQRELRAPQLEGRRVDLDLKRQLC
jgi:hypothetical protein